MSKPLVSIFTANSNSGKSCLKELVEKYSDRVNIRAVFRTEEKAKWYRETYQNVEIVTDCDADRPESLNIAFKGVNYALIVTPHDHTRGFSDDAKLTKNMIDSAVESNVEYIVLVASFTVNHPERMSILSSRFAPSERLLENYSREKGLKWTVLRGGVFMENNLWNIKKSLETSVYKGFDVCVPYIDTKDIGRCAAVCLASDNKNIQQHNGKYYEMNGPERLDGYQIAEIISKVFNKKITYEPIQMDKNSFPEALYQCFSFMMEQKDCVPFGNDVKDLTGLWSSYENFMRDHYNEIVLNSN
ncbi:unnamed protein product [Brachionus calyciflorus]|uniref:NmrA-like domain-containing protein n=1 Tax=Brachionus calyciflorus TaxID=104777 RepID=A0A814Q9B8_9BILA|nr:unnamed protein product [Brachionus calyciflorus]